MIDFIKEYGIGFFCDKELPPLVQFCYYIEKKQPLGQKERKHQMGQTFRPYPQKYLKQV